jgi:hypothetical protein
MGAPTHRQPVRPAEANRPDDRRDCASVGTNGPALEEPMSGSDLITISENIRETAREVVRLHAAREWAAAKQRGQQLPWAFDYVAAHAYFSQFMNKRASEIRRIGPAFGPEDLAADAMLGSVNYLKGSWGHAVAIAEGCPPDQLWSHRAFVGSAKEYAQRKVLDYRRHEWGELRAPRPAAAPDTEAPGASTEGSPDRYRRRPGDRISIGDTGEGGDLRAVDLADKHQLSPAELIEIAETEAEARAAVSEGIDGLSGNDQFIVRQLLAWYADHDHLRGFYDVLLPALAATGNPTNLVAARQRVSAAQMRLMGRIVASRRDALRAALVSIPAPTPERDPLTFTGRIAVSYLIEIAGKASWETTFARIRTHLKELEVDTIAPWNDASTAREALFDSFGAVATAYRERQGSSFWAATN